MANSKIYTRVYSSSSTGPLVSGKGRSDKPLTSEELRNEFQTHANLPGSEPTALVSVSNRIIDTVKRAFEKHRWGREAAEDIWILFIEVPAARDRRRVCRYHWAEPVAENLCLPEPKKFRHEFVFEHEVPEECVLHGVSLATLMSRKFDWGKYWGPSDARPQHVSTRDLRELISMSLPLESPWEVGLELGILASAFGARAPSDWIAHQIFDDCVTHRASEGFREMMDHGIETFLIDYWLEDLGSSPEYEEFKHWSRIMEDTITDYQVDFWETWYPAYDCNMFYEHYDVEGLEYDEEWEKLQRKVSDIEACVEQKAVDLGL